MNIKIARFLLICTIIVGGLAALLGIYTAYVVDQNVKILHYNNMIEECMKTPGSKLEYEAWSPIFGAGIKMKCTILTRGHRRL